MKINDLNLEPYKKIYLLANNVHQIITGFLRTETIHNFTESNSPEELTQQYKEIIEAGVENFDNLISAYVLLMAITNLNYQKAMEILSSIDLKPLKWGEKIRDYYQQTYINTAIFSTNATARVLMPNRNQTPVQNLQNNARASQVSVTTKSDATHQIIKIN